LSSWFAAFRRDPDRISGREEDFPAAPRDRFLYGFLVMIRSLLNLSLLVYHQANVRWAVAEPGFASSPGVPRNLPRLTVTASGGEPLSGRS